MDIGALVSFLAPLLPQLLNAAVGEPGEPSPVARLWDRLKAETIYVPLHNQTVTYAMRRAFDIPADVSNQPKIKYVGPPGT